MLLSSDTLFLEHDFLKLYHVYVLIWQSIVLFEYEVMTAADCEKCVMLDTQNCLIFWQCIATHHLRKFNERYSPPMSPCPHRFTSNTCRRAPLHQKCMQRQTLYFHESHPNSDSLVRCVKLLFCLIFHFKRNLMLVYQNSNLLVWLFM